MELENHELGVRALVSSEPGCLSSWSRLDDQEVLRRTSTECSSRDRLQPHGWIADEDVCGSPPIDDNEVPAADPANMRNSGQAAAWDIFVRSFDALGKEPDAFCDFPEGQQIRTPAVKC